MGDEWCCIHQQQLRSSHSQQQQHTSSEITRNHGSLIDRGIHYTWDCRCYGAIGGNFVSVYHFQYHKVWYESLSTTVFVVHTTGGSSDSSSRPAVSSIRKSVYHHSTAASQTYHQCYQYHQSKHCSCSSNKQCRQSKRSQQQPHYTHSIVAPVNSRSAHRPVKHNPST